MPRVMRRLETRVSTRSMRFAAMAKATGLGASLSTAVVGPRSSRAGRTGHAPPPAPTTVAPPFLTFLPRLLRPRGR